MSNRRLAVGTVAALAAIGFAATGCGGGTTGNSANAGASASASATASSSASLAPKDALIASTTQLQKTSYKFTISAVGLTGQGATDAAAKATTLSASGVQGGTPIKIDFIMVDPDAYMKLDLGQYNSRLGVPTGKWMHFNLSAMGADVDLPIQSSGDPADVNGLFAGLVDVKTTDGKTFTGTIDMTKATGSSAPGADVLDKAGVKAKAVPFTATLDDQGRLNTVKIDGTGIDPGLTVNISLSDYGTPANITKPDASQVVEAPDAVQQMFKA